MHLCDWRSCTSSLKAVHTYLNTLYSWYSYFLQTMIVYFTGTTDASPYNRIHDRVEKNHLSKNSLKLNVSSDLHIKPFNSDEIPFPKKITNSAGK